MMNPEQRRSALRSLLVDILPVVEAMPVARRADAYDGIAAAAWNVDEETMGAALKTAEAIREAEAHQMNFASLLTDPAK